MKQRNGLSVRRVVVVSLAALLASSCAKADRTSDSGEESSGKPGKIEPGTPLPQVCDNDCAAVVTPPCFFSSCDALTRKCVIVPRAKGSPCDDGLFCTVGESCDEGVCVSGKQNDCGKKPSTCAVVHCDEASHSCFEGPAKDGAPCSPSDACTVHASCKAGACQGEPKSCLFAPVPDDCHVAVCNSETGSCEAVVGNEGGPCEDGGDPCLVGKTCAAGVCQGGTPKSCAAAGDDCNVGVCEATTGQCVKAPKPAGEVCASAADECNAGQCDAAGACQKVPTPGGPCASATDACNTGTCNAAGACVASAVNEGGSCEDGDACTMGEVCGAGACKGGKADGYVSYLFETFENNAAGWTLEGQWQIGKAKASPGHAVSGNEDPAQDHTPTSDNGVAGVVIGGYVSTQPTGPRYLVSPPIDTTKATDLWLSFARFLNSDYSPYMTSTIDVFDGQAWQNVWTSKGPPAVQDEEWTKVAYNLTAYKNAALRVRFGYAAANDPLTVSGWNVDDVIVANRACGTTTTR